MTSSIDVDSESLNMPDAQLSEIPPAWAIELQSAIADRFAGFESTLQSLSEQINSAHASKIQTSDESIAGNEDSLLPPQQASSTVDVQPPAPEQDTWMCAMLGQSLYADSRVADSTIWMEENVEAGNMQALALLGQLLVFRCATADRKPSLLRDLGEALYRCFPKTRDLINPFEDALVDWVGRQCEVAGLPNSIELVHPGDRFDATRHSPVERGGVEVAEVLGWVVLRDGGKVYSKASVQTR